MTPAQFQKLFEARLNKIKQYANEVLPRHIGKIAVDHYQQNFIKGGYVDDVLRPWRPSKRFGQDKSAASGYGTLLSSRKELYNSIRPVASTGRVVIASSLVYSRIHNEGGIITQQITPAMRRFAWAKYYESGKENQSWKAMAITKKQSRIITIPQRKYMGKGAELNRLILSRAMKDIRNIILNP
ncbi:MAG: phage virion morphogenesis protein [Bacteroidota bacterium]